MFTSFAGLVGTLVGLLNMLISVLVAGLVAMLMYTGFMYIYKGAQGKDAKSQRSAALWGIVGLFLVMSVWGIIKIAGGALLGDSYMGPQQNSSWEWELELFTL